MDRRRLQLQSLLREILGSDQVHYVKPGSLEMVYPAIVYNRQRSDVKHANNDPYNIQKSYSLTAMSRNADDPLFDKLERLRMCTLERTYEMDQLHHHAYTIFF